MAFNRLWGDRIHHIVILDSSAILMMFEFSFDFEDELTRLLGAHHIVVPSAIIQELQVLSKQGEGKKHRNAAAALKLIIKYDVVETKEQDGDNAVVAVAQSTKGVAVTNDIALRRKLKALSIPVIFLRGKKKLALE